MATPQTVLDLNRAAWERYKDGRWSTPVSPEQIAAARRGEWEAYLIESKPVPRDWFPALRGADVLALAAGGGQQGPILAAAGAKVTVLDASPAQLAQDRLVAERTTWISKPSTAIWRTSRGLRTGASPSCFTQWRITSCRMYGPSGARPSAC